MSDSAATTSSTIITSNTSEPLSATEPSPSAYIPPHLRCKQPVPAPPPSNVSHPLDQKLFTASEVSQHFGLLHGGTVNPSINNHREIAYILIFLNQHPQYPSKIFVKSNLDLLFKDAAQGSEMNPLLRDLEIPLFEEEKGEYKYFKFKSWVKVSKAERLEKGSEALIDMLTLKWRRDTPRRSDFGMREKERERERSRKGAEVIKMVEKGANGEDRVVENLVYKKDPDDEVEEEENLPVSQPGVSLEKRLEQTVPRSEWAWKNSLSVDWAVVTLEFIQTYKGNPLHGPRVKLLAPVKETLDQKYEDLLKSTEAISLDEANEYMKENMGKATIRGNGKRPLNLDGADDTITLLVNGDLDSVSIPSSPILEPVTPKKGSAVNLSTYSLSKSTDGTPAAEKSRPSGSNVGGGLGVSHSDISQSYISTGMGESVAEDFGTMSATSTDADESDRWSELSEQQDENWMAVERGGMAKETTIRESDHS
ncbi:hypothetical protein TWF694_010791 [Orbilia ellipsospora]|uniref:Uncharacterized protein n=1 Tax=Orbilia ellipsospora TaxID=2528407 RepID=A0AAV9X730_9PEZI